MEVSVLMKTYAVCRNNSLRMSLVMARREKRAIKFDSGKRRSFSDPVKWVCITRRIISSEWNNVETCFWMKTGLYAVMEWPKGSMQLDQQLPEDKIFISVVQYQRLTTVPDDFVSWQEPTAMYLGWVTDTNVHLNLFRNDMATAALANKTLQGPFSYDKRHVLKSKLMPS